tara:strand:+ start:2571 stop:2693 length:123 start_codon:yes stop_codon:yes gene_type:complete
VKDKIKKWYAKWKDKRILSKAFKKRDKTKNACKWDLEKEA